jgi:hypothetical protein
MNTEIIKRANYWINNEQNFEQEMLVLEEEMEEHKLCYSLYWCIKSELNLSWDERASWCGIGRILISKDGQHAEFEGSSPGVDWVYHFENKLQGLEDFWRLEITYSKDNISKLKAILKCSTLQLEQMINKNNKIILTESKPWCDQYTELEEIVQDLKNVEIPCKLEVKTRKIKHGDL